MEIYVQEVGASTYLNQISAQSKQKILCGLRLFPEMLVAVRKFEFAQIPATTWFFLLTQQSQADGSLFDGVNG